MLDCWLEVPSHRPSFKSIYDQLTEFLNDGKVRNYLLHVLLCSLHSSHLCENLMFKYGHTGLVFKVKSGTLKAHRLGLQQNEVPTREVFTFEILEQSGKYPVGIPKPSLLILLLQ